MFDLRWLLQYDIPGMVPVVIAVVLGLYLLLLAYFVLGAAYHAFVVGLRPGDNDRRPLPDVTLTPRRSDPDMFPLTSTLPDPHKHRPLHLASYDDLRD